MNIKMHLKHFVLLIGLALFFFACDGGETADQASGPEVFRSNGVVEKINAEKKEITIAHENIPGLMSAMTMDFPVADEKLLGAVRDGDRVSFELERRNDEEIVLTKITKTGETARLDPAVIYKDNCARCHGDRGRGVEDKGISLVEGHALHHPEEDFIRQVTDGKDDKMPAFRDKLTEEEIRAVVRYVREEIQGRKDDAPKEDEAHQH